MSGYRIPGGGRVLRDRTLGFTFDGQEHEGYAGDTLASALMANGVTLVGRSFKYHRPRGIVTAGPEEPNALVTLIEGEARRPNIPATAIRLCQGLVAESQNRWPRLDFDLMAVNGLFAPLVAAGFYYKTFMWPASFWEKVYEPLIRRAAGLGRAGQAPIEGFFETVHAHCDVLVIGDGVAGRAAARAAAERGRRVIIVERTARMGGADDVDAALVDWRAMMDAAIRGENVEHLPADTIIGLYDHGVAVALETSSEGEARCPDRVPPQRLRIIRATETVIATGAQERLIAFPDNDRPGVMLATAARTYVNRFGVAPGHEAAFFITNDEAYAAVRDLRTAGVTIAAVVDPRGPTAVSGEARDSGLPVLFDHVVSGVGGRMAVSSVLVRKAGGGPERRIPCDLLCVSGGYNPRTELATQAGLKTQWREDIHAFAAVGDRRFKVVGAAAGVFGRREAAIDGARAHGGPADAWDFPVPARRDGPILPLWEVKGRSKAFVDLQHDVTADDMRLAAREGYVSAEHAKRYTTHGMGTDQGKTGGLIGAAILAGAQDKHVSEVGVSKPRPFVSPVSWGALAGAEAGAHFKPERRLALHDWHEANGAVFVRIGLWLRPLVYSPAGDTSWGPVMEEARAVRASVGVTDVSSLGKLDVQGADAGRFLDLIYANTFSNLPVGKARYGLMLREDGVVFDDGTTSRLAEDHFLVTTTTAKAAEAQEHLEFHAQCVWPDLDVQIVNVADQWAQFAVAGPKARETLRDLVDIDLGNDAFPFMAARQAEIAGVAGRIFRLSFSGELAYEVAAPARQALAIWQAILAAGAAHGIRPYGLDALNVLRIEKGHVAGSELNGQTTAADLGLGRMLKKTGDFVGRHLLSRPGLVDPKRLQLVGLHPLDPALRLRSGAHLVSRSEPSRSQGYLTAACMSVIREGWIGLALLEGGHGRHGERLVATSPVHGESVEVEIVSPHRHDLENDRVRA